MTVEGIPQSGENDVASHAAYAAITGLPYFDAFQDIRRRRTWKPTGSEEVTQQKAFIEKIPAGHVIHEIRVFIASPLVTGTATFTLGFQDVDSPYTADTDALVSTPQDLTTADYLTFRPTGAAATSSGVDRWLVLEWDITSGTWNADAGIAISWNEVAPQRLTLRFGRGNIGQSLDVKTPLDAGSIPIPPPDLPPTFDSVTVTSTVAEGGAISLGAVASDPEGFGITYRWEVVGSAPAGVVIVSPTSPSTFATTGNYTTDQEVTFRVIATDVAGQSSSTSRTVTITADNDGPTNVNAGADQTGVVAGSTVILQASGSDPEQEPLLYTWTQTAGSPTVELFGLFNQSGASTDGSANFIAPSTLSGTTLTFQVSVSDGTNTAVTDTMTVTVEPDAGIEPSGDLEVYAGGMLYIEEGATATLNAQTRNAAGAVTYFWEQTGGTSVALSSTTAKAPTFTCPAVSSDTLLTFRVTADDGTTAAQVTTQVTVEDDATDYVYTDGDISLTFNGRPARKHFWNGDLAFQADAGLATTAPTATAAASGTAENGGMVNMIFPYLSGTINTAVQNVSTSLSELAIYSGDGSTLSFSGQSLTITGPATHVGQCSVFVRATIGGTAYTFRDQGDGSFLTYPQLVSGTIIYSSGALSLVFAAGFAPDSGTDIDVTSYGTYSSADVDSTANGQGFCDEYTRNGGSSVTNYDESNNDVVGISSGSPLTFTAGDGLVKTSDADPPTGGFAGGVTSMDEAIGVIAMSAEQLALVDDETFRPDPYGDPGGDRTLYTFRDIDYTPLNTAWTASETLPAFGDTGQNALNALYLDLDVHFQGTESIPVAQHDNYGEHILATVVDMGVAVASNQASLTQRREWLHRLIQMGLDIEGMVREGMCWSNEGGTPQGRKLPAVFARKFLGLGAPSGGKWEIQTEYANAFWSHYGNRNQRIISEDTDNRSPFGDDWQCGRVTALQVNGPTPRGYTQAQIGMPEWDGKGYQKTAVDRFSNIGETGSLINPPGEDQYRYIIGLLWAQAWLVYFFDMRTEWANETSLDYCARVARICDDPSWDIYERLAPGGTGGLYAQRSVRAVGEQAIANVDMYWEAPFSDKQKFIRDYQSHFPTSFPAGQEIDFPPIANAGSDQTVASEASVSLDATGSTDDNAIASYSWVQVSGTSVTLTDEDTSTPDFTAPEVTSGTDDLVFEVTVADSLGSTSSDTVTITVQPDAPPIANAGPNQTVAPSATGVALDGTGSTDDAGISTYAWVQTSGTTVTLSDAAVAEPTFTAPASDDTLVFQLTVTDTGGAIDTDSVTITVAAPVWDGTTAHEAFFIPASSTPDGTPGFDVEVVSSGGIAAPSFSANTSYTFAFTFTAGNLNDRVHIGFNPDGIGGSGTLDLEGFLVDPTQADPTKASGQTYVDESVTGGFAFNNDITADNPTYTGVARRVEIVVTQNGADTDYEFRCWIPATQSRPATADISGTRSGPAAQNGTPVIWVVNSTSGATSAQIYDMVYVDDSLEVFQLANTF